MPLQLVPSSLRRLRPVSRELLEHLGGVLQQHLHHNPDNGEIAVTAHQGGGDAPPVKEAYRGEYHGEAEGYQPQTADRGQYVKPEDACVFMLYPSEKGVEVGLLGIRENKQEGLRALQKLMEVGKPFAQVFEKAVEGCFPDGKDIFPLDAHIPAVKDETAEQAVFRIGDERLDLAGRAGKQRGQARLGEFDKLLVLPAV